MVSQLNFLQIKADSLFNQFIEFRTSLAANDKDLILQILSGIIFTLLGYALTVKLKKPEKGSDYTFGIVTAFCISGTATFFREVIEFFCDFLLGTNLLECEAVGDDHWLFRLFGPMKSPFEQRYLFDTDEDMLFSVTASLMTALALFVAVRLRHKELFKKQRLSVKEFFAGSFDRFKNKLKIEKEKLTSQCSIFDFIFWWGTRALMLYAFFVMEVRADANLLFANLIGTFAITLLHIIMPSDSFFAKINYRVQTVLVTLIFLGSYAGNYVFVYGILGRYDLFLHFISGILCVIAGYYVAITLVEVENKKDIFLISLMAFCFSCMIMPAWEATEFIGDYIWGTSNQGFYWGPAEDSFFFKLFGTGVGNTKLYYLFDTYYDMLLAFSTTVPSAFLVPIFCFFQNKKKLSNQNLPLKNADEKNTVKC
ncbi:MAG: hypothetical protein ACI4GC_06395 [Acutalibacteraceae bacterium]